MMDQKSLEIDEKGTDEKNLFILEIFVFGSYPPHFCGILLPEIILRIMGVFEPTPGPPPFPRNRN